MAAPQAEQALTVLEEAAMRERAVVAQPVSEAAAVLNMIERVAQNPNADIDKMLRLLDMRNSLMEQQAKADFNNAMARAQADMRVVVADKDNSQTRSKYASYAALDDAVRPIYTRHGFAVSFNTEDCPKADHVRIVANVSLGSYERMYRMDLPADGKGAKGGDVMTKTHATMSAASYGKRGLLILIFNIPVADKWDDDGNAAAQPHRTITEDQVIELRELLESFDRDEKAFCEKVAKVARLSDIRADDFEAARNIIKRAGAKK